MEGHTIVRRVGQAYKHAVKLWLLATAVSLVVLLVAAYLFGIDVIDRLTPALLVFGLVGYVCQRLALLVIIEWARTLPAPRRQKAPPAVRLTAWGTLIGLGFLFLGLVALICLLPYSLLDMSWAVVAAPRAAAGFMVIGIILVAISFLALTLWCVYEAEQHHRDLLRQEFFATVFLIEDVGSRISFAPAA